MTEKRKVNMAGTHTNPIRELAMTAPAGYPGKYYEMTGPETLDLAQRAEYALHGIAGTIDPADEYMMWFEVFWCKNPPYMVHSGCDVQCTPKFLDAMMQLRLMCGSDKYTDIEQGMLESVIGYLDPKDGLYYSLYKPEKRPWHMDGYTSSGYTVKPEDYAFPGTSGMAMSALVLRDEMGLASYGDRLEALARGLEKVSIQKDDYAYFPEGGKSGHPFSRPRSGWQNTDEPGDEHEYGERSVVSSFGHPIRGLSMWAARTGDERALDLAGRFARFVMKRKFWGHPADPPMLAGAERGHVDSHFHARASALRGLLEYGIVAGDRHACDFVRSSYEQMRHYGIHEMGFFPTWPNTGQTLMEGCFLGDLVALAVKMSDAGIGDYWEDADRVIRNHLVEAQYLRRDFLERVVADTPETAPPTDQDMQQFTDAEKVYPGQRCYDDVLGRCLGIFASYLTPTFSAGRVMQCCTANAARGLYYAWEAITRRSDDEAQVNLLLNRSAPWLDVESCLPYEGKVLIRNKTARRIAVRIPTWVKRRELSCLVNGVARRVSIAGHYGLFDDLKPCDLLELNFPVAEETFTATANAQTDEETVYTITMRGNTVVDISPRDERSLIYPLYLRDHLRGRQAPMKMTKRFVLERTPPSW
ncbi:MAG: hypothetical protein V2A58_17715 [Planctomycetota bacterium]